MFCNSCHGDLKDFESIIHKMQKCPLCGATLDKKVARVAQKDVAALCLELVKNVGEKVFANEATLDTELKRLNAPEFEDARDRISLLVLKHIPSSMYRVKEFSDAEKIEVLEACSKRLCVDLGLRFEVASEMLDMLQQQVWQKKFPLFPNFTDGVFQDPRDGQIYKTVKIGGQIWMKENLRYKCQGLTDAECYEERALQYVAVKGWRLPTEADFNRLVNFAKGSGFGDPSSVLMSRKGWEKYSVTPTDNLGFDAKPFKDESFVSYWTKNGGAFQISLGKTCITRGRGELYVRLIKEDSAEDSSSSKSESKKSALKAAARKAAPKAARKAFL